MNIFEDKIALESKFLSIQQRIILEGRSSELIAKEAETLENLEHRRQQEEILWKKKLRIQWIKEGHRNSNFFHNAMIQHHHNNRFFPLIGKDGDRKLQQQDLESELVYYFIDLLMEDNKL